jgi:hypothetical protein
MPLRLTVEGKTGFNYATDEFVEIPTQEVELEHCLLAIARWESKWKKSFFTDSENRTPKEMMDYFRCMAMNDVNPDFVICLTNEQITEIMNEITDVKSATTITRQKSDPHSNETLTSELVYYYMAQAQLPFEVCERWHFSRLMKILEIASIKSDPENNKKMPSHEWAAKQSALNKARRLAAKSKG